MSFAGRRLVIAVAAISATVPVAVAAAHPVPKDAVEAPAKDSKPGKHGDDDRSTPVAAPTPAPKPAPTAPPAPPESATKDRKAKPKSKPKGKDEPKGKDKDKPKDDGKPKAKDKPKPKGKDESKGKGKGDKPEDEGSGDASPAPAATPTPAKPVKGKRAVGHRTSGTVTVTLPGATEATPLETSALPLGATIDATHGRVEIATALPGGKTQQAAFWGGRFRLSQSERTGRVAIHMPKVSIARRCGRPAGTAAASSVLATASKRKKRRNLKSLWVSDHDGSFSTHGRNSVATVRGTQWVTRERCDGTFTYVRKGRVDVRDRKTGRVVKVRAGRGFLARN
jgi:hypothetical protein